jgi:hypothetical protein
MRGGDSSPWAERANLIRKGTFRKSVVEDRKVRATSKTHNMGTTP